MIDITKLTTEPGLNLREDLGDMIELTASIRANGILVPLRVKADLVDDKVIIVDGHRRFHALEAANRAGAGLTKVPCITEPKTVSPTDRIVSQFLCNSGKPLTALEEAKGIKTLTEQGQTMRQIADRLGKSDQWVSNRLVLANAPADVKTAITKGTMTVSAAVQVGRSPEPEEAVKKATKKATERAEAKGETPKVKATDVKQKPAKPQEVQVVGIIRADLIRAFDEVVKQSNSADREHGQGMRQAVAVIKQVLQIKE